MRNSGKRTALLSVYNKDGIVDFARGLVALGWDILASGGTADALRKAGVAVRDVATLVGGGAILGHRVVTLSREVHAGLLAQYTDADIRELESLGIPFIDMVCVNLYPLEEEISKDDATVGSVLDKTDIGGPTMLRSAAKGLRIAVADPADYDWVLAWISDIKDGTPKGKEVIHQLAAKAEFTVARYVLASARYHGWGQYEGIMGTRLRDVAYGESPAMVPSNLFRVGSITEDPLGIAAFRQVGGTLPSYINTTDLDRLLQTVTHIAAGFHKNFGGFPFIAVGCKHGNPCGAGVGKDPETTIIRMVEGNPEALFGGCVMVNFEMTPDLASLLTNHRTDGVVRRVLDMVIAPGFSEGATDGLRRKNDRCRMFTNSALATLDANSLDTGLRYRQVRGGFLTQPNYVFVLNIDQVVPFGDCTEQQECDMVLAWALGSTSNSNTIMLVRGGQLLGSGLAQVSRKLACQVAVIAAQEAGHDVTGAVAYSDSFFPFTDGPKVLIHAGISTVFATTGSVRDEQVRDVFTKADVAFYTLPDKEARGFYGH